MEVERRDEYVELLNYLNSDRKIKKEADFTNLPGLENFSRVAKHWKNICSNSWNWTTLTRSYKNIANDIIGNIDDQGYLLAYPSPAGKIMQQVDVSRPTVDKVLKISPEL